MYTLSMNTPESLNTAEKCVDKFGIIFMGISIIAHALILILISHCVYEPAGIIVVCVLLHHRTFLALATSGS